MKISIIKPPIFLLPIMLILYSCQSKNTTIEKDKLVQENVKQDTALPADEVMLTEKQVETMGIQLGSVEKKNLTNLVKANGFIILPPQQKANVSTFIGGVVKSVNVIAGNQVKKGQILALLESTEYIQLQEDYLKAKSNLVFLEKDYARQKEMLSANATSEKMVQQALNNYSAIRATVLSLQNKLKLLDISANDLDKGKMTTAISVVSPITGYVQKVNVNIGKFADPSLVMFEIINSHRLFIDLQIYEQDMDKIKAGQKVLLSLPNESTPIGEATIYAIDRALDSATKSITVHAKITKNGTSVLIPGIYVNAYIQTSNDKVTAVPDEAIYKEGQTENIFILSEIKKEGQNKEYIFLAKEVKTGISNAGFTEVAFPENISQNARIVTKGTYYIISEKNKGAGGDQD
ncbi:MAG: efflux RND transporter periplasmic adaptor subunit [Bacteroidota bacterium]|nr:efflux RND transporter periplasmic adaptor subunit [Bacteroidota bacterium]